MTDLDDYKQWKKDKGYDKDFSRELTIYTKQAYLDACEAKNAVIAELKATVIVFEGMPSKLIELGKKNDRLQWELNKANELHESAASKLWDVEQDLIVLREFANSMIFPPKDTKTMSLASSLGLINQDGVRTKVLSGDNS